MMTVPAFVVPNIVMGPPFIVRNCLEYMRCMRNNVFDFVGRK